MQFRLAILTLIIICSASLSCWAVETKDIKFPIKNADPVTFSHEIHLKKYNSNCKICHNAIFNIKDPKHYTMNDMEKTKSCGACHTGVKAFSVTDSKSCMRCHKGKPRTIELPVKGAGNVVFSHVNHLGKLNGDCRGCHNGRVITGKRGPVAMAQMEKGQTCGACHNGKKAFTVQGNCGNCHKGMKPHDIAFRIQGIAPASFSHDIHTAAFSCRECHTRLFAFKAGAKHFTMAEMAKGKSCGSCHNGKEAFSVAGDCNKCHKGFKPGVITFKTNTGEVKFSHDIHIDAFKCADCHTKIFPFKAGAVHYTMGDMEQGKSCGACHNGKEAFSSAGDCDKCHRM